MIRIERAPKIDDSKQHREENHDDQCKFDQSVSSLWPTASRHPLTACDERKIGHGLSGPPHFHIRIVVVRETVIGDGIPGYVKSALKVPKAVT
jgi:hypothetical protein